MKSRSIPAHAPLYQEVYDLLDNKVLEEGVVLERKTKGETLPPAFLRLQDVARDLDALIRRSKNRPNKDLAKLADQLRQVISKWEV